VYIRGKIEIAGRRHESKTLIYVRNLGKPKVNQGNLDELG
jgi:hypothetical protein